MSTTMDAAKRDEIFTAIPLTFTVQGVVYTINKKWANIFRPDQVTEGAPTVVLNFSTIQVPVHVPLMGDRIRASRRTVIDTITYVTGTDIYDLPFNQPDTDLKDTIKVTAIIAGTSTIFVKDTDFRILKDGVVVVQNFDGTYVIPGGNEIDFTIAATKPDNGTTVTIEYIVYRAIQIRGGEFEDTISVNVYAIDDTRNSGNRVHGEIIADAIITEIKELFEHRINVATSLAAQIIDDIVFEDFSEVRDLDFITAGIDYLRRKQFDMTAKYIVTVQTSVETIEIVPVTIDEVNL